MSSSLEYSCTSWGSPTAPKRALLLHGLTGTGAVFFKVAAILIANGYRVEAPDLLAHGWSPRAAPSDRYTIPLLASHLAKHLSKEKYNVIAGVSFGSNVIISLLPQLQYPPARAVLVEPLLDKEPFPKEAIDGMVAKTNEPPNEEELMKGNPTWIREEAVLKRLAFMQTDPRLIEELFDELNQGKLSHSLIPSASALPNTELIILAGDPDLRSVYPASNASLLKEKYPHVKFGRKLGATHDTHKDKPDVVASVIMEGLKGQMGVEVLNG